MPAKQDPYGSRCRDPATGRFITKKLCCKLGKLPRAICER